MPASRLALPTALAALLALAGCGGVVAGDAPALLTTDAIAARAADAQDTTRGTRAASELAWRGAQLRARAEQIRRASLPNAERSDLLRRADALKQQQD
ncbi:MAG: hypothetical protein H6898_17285 [Rhodobacter sp.]|nr:hypothetical protein [Paracoccaceae bacterium]MCC0078312.1 hypothetical protein [Rhodobacter sp.]